MNVSHNLEPRRLGPCSACTPFCASLVAPKLVPLPPRSRRYPITSYRRARAAARPYIREARWLAVKGMGGRGGRRRRGKAAAHSSAQEETAAADGVDQPAALAAPPLTAAAAASTTQ